MARYIDIDLLKKELRKLVNETDCNIAIMPDVFEVVENQPTADVKEVVRGEWIRSVFAEDFHKCSVCDGVWNRKFDFCPSCGADMREGE